jgi:hypothetical protein
MRFSMKLSERELDGILAGRLTNGEFDDVALFFRELRNSFGEAPSHAVEAHHLAGIFEEALHLQPSVHKLPTLRGTRRLRNPFRRLAARATIAAVGLAALAAFSGAAYAGVLPRPVQDTVAHVAHHLGLALPETTTHHPSQPREGDNSGASHTGPGQPGEGDNSGGSHTGTGQPDQGSSGQDTGDHGNGQGASGQGNNAGGGGSQGANTNSTGNTGQGNAQGDGARAGGSGGDQGAQRSVNQGAQPTTVDGAQNEQRTRGAENNQPSSTPNDGSGASGGQLGNGSGSGNDAGNGN